MNTHVSHRLGRAVLGVLATTTIVLGTASAAQAAPAVEFTTPVAEARVPSDAATRIEVAAGDPAGVTTLEFYADDRRLCADTTAPYTCDFLPGVDERGKTTLVAVATNRNGEKTTAVRTIRVLPVKPTRVTFTTKATRTDDGWTALTSGRLVMPNSIAADFCREGGAFNVKLQFGRKARILTVPMNTDCTFTAPAVTVPAGQVSSKRQIRTRVRYLGNAGVYGTQTYSALTKLR